MKRLDEELNLLAASDLYPLHMPGHKRRAFPVAREGGVSSESSAENAKQSMSGGAETVQKALSAAASIDITEIDGFDNLHAPEGVIADEMAFAARFYGTKQTYFLVNGSTVGLLAAISAAVPFGGRILIERGCHIAVYHAAVLRHLRIEYLEHFTADRNPEKGVFDAVVITSPSYEGLKKDVVFYARLAHGMGAVLIVDEAHGAHFSRHPYFPKSAIKEGADLVIQSAHKTLPCLTQTALLHNVSGRVPAEKIERFLDIYETSSPSYLFLASMTTQIHAMAERKDYFDLYVKQLKKLRETLSGMTHLHLVGGRDAVVCQEEEGMIPGAREHQKLDPGKVTISTAYAGLSATELYDLLRKKYHLQPEMKTLRAVLLMTSVADTEEGFARLTESLMEIDANLVEEQPAPCTESAQRASEAGIPAAEELSVLPMAEAYEADAEDVPLTDAAGRISAEFVIVYPPDSPVIVPGERFTHALCRNIAQMETAGLTLTGIRDGCVRVVRGE